MHGGMRQGAGRKTVHDKKQAVSVYINSEEKELIENLPLPNCTSFSGRIRELIELGIDLINVDIKENEKQVTYIDLFSGLGGIRIGFEQALADNKLFGKCVFSSDIKESAIKAYKDNFGEDPKCDITKINPSNLPNFDFLLAGFPCQAFSQAGLGLGFQDARGTLFFDVAKILLAKKPIGFVLENVEGLVNHDKGKTFSVILNTLDELNYKVFYKVLKAADFGVPQNRERIYIVGFNSEYYKEDIDFSFPQPTNIKTKVGNILDPVVDEKYTISDKLWEGHKRRKREHKLKGNGFGYSLFNENSQYTNTISARYYKDGSEILIEQKNKNPRKITPREASRLQGFPKEFIIPVSDTQAYKQFGNSVAVPVIYNIASQMMKTDKNFHKQKKS